jgi:hypothetical protein
MLVALTPDGERMLENVTHAIRADLRTLDRVLGSVQASLTRLRGGHYGSEAVRTTTPPGDRCESGAAVRLTCTRPRARGQRL